MILVVVVIIYKRHHFICASRANVSYLKRVPKQKVFSNNFFLLMKDQALKSKKFTGDHESTPKKHLQCVFKITFNFNCTLTSQHCKSFLSHARARYRVSTAIPLHGSIGDTQAAILNVFGDVRVAMFNVSVPNFITNSYTRV
uniref:Uncharacterized protein n=1 Tax=Rhipicephalus microplus TaxID=6941 RepID=A0A6G5AI10_RHIMP